MLKIIIISLIYIFSFSNLSAEIVNKIEIVGNKRVSAETVKIYGDLKINKNYSDKDLNLILENLYSTNFFEDIRAEVSNGVLKINLTEYPIINQLIILGEPSNKYREEIKKVIKSKEKDSFIKSNISSDIETIKSLYSSLGFNFTNVKSKIKKTNKNRLDLVFEIEKGEVTRITKISFIGDKKIKDKRLRDIIASEEYKFWKFISRNTKFNQNLLNLDIRLLTNYYKSMGYYDVNISSNSAEIKKSGNVELIYSIDSGKRYSISKIITNADQVFDKNIFYSLNKNYKKIIGTYYSPFKVKKLLEEIDELIENNNLQFVEHNVEEIIEGDSITIKFNIFEGQRVLVERINILGNNITNESVIRGELLIDEGDPFTDLGLEKSISKIKSRNIFKNVSSKVIDGSSPDLKTIEIEVVEQPTGEISAGAGIGTSGGSFAFTVKENNWLGEGKRVSFDMAVDAESIAGTVNYTDPNYDLLGNELNYYVSSKSNDKPDRGFENSIISAGISTAFEQYRDIYTNLGISAAYDDLRTDNTASASLKKQSGDFTELTASYGFRYDKRNRAFMPTNGSIISFQQSLPLYADKSFIDNSFSVSSYKTLNENVIGAGKFIVSAINGLNDEDVRISKRKTLSSSRLRGFEKGKVGPVDGLDHVGGNYSAAVNLEASMPNLLPDSTNTDIAFFLDFGNVWGVDYDDTIDDSNKWRSSTGVAASWISPLGPMTFILSTNISKASTDETEGFNFNLGTTF
tara:strand:+ start:1650 stop:3881 length:2232 start_codon:yes stop_codon:yes gene_type:complete